jgi:alkylhydroperoxidase family enzyme
LHIDSSIIDAVLADWTTADLDARLRGGLSLCEALTKHPQDIDADLLAGLEAAGLEREAIEDAANVTFHFNFINRLADAFDFPLLEEGPRRKLAKMLDRAGKVLGAKRPEPSWSRGRDGVLLPVEVQVGRERALYGEGVSPAELRQAVEAHAAGCFGALRSGTGEVPEPLRGYVDKVARWAYKVIDEDVDELKQAGYENEAIFELSFCAAMGASVAGLERLYAVLFGESGRAEHRGECRRRL